MSGVSQVSGRRRRKFRAASNRVDRISELPEPLKLHILSLLPTTEDRIRTGALSRSWKDLWTSIPKLNFCFDYALDEDNQSAPDDFVKHVQKTLNRILSCGTKVKEFVVKWPYDDVYSSDVDKWIRFAARKETEKFELDFDPWKGTVDDARFCELPEHIYSNSYFRSLRFYLCEVIIPLGTTVSWDSLKHLTIDYGGFDDESLAKIVAGAPALEFLDLRLEYGISNLHFGNSVLKKLVLHMGDWFYNDEAAFEISAPSVESLEVSCSFETCKLVDMTSLVEATLFGRLPFRIRDYPVLTQEVVSSLLKVKRLTVGTWIIQGIAKLQTNDVRPLFPKCKCLTVDTHLWKEDPIAIASLLKNTPEVETLIVTIADLDSKNKFRNPCGHVSSNIDQYWTSQEMGVGYLTCLRTVKFIGFWDYRTFAFPFLQFLLKNVRGLQKVMIDFETEGYELEITPTEIFDASQKLLSFPRSSPDAKIMILPTTRIRWVLK